MVVNSSLYFLECGCGEGRAKLLYIITNYKVAKFCVKRQQLGSCLIHSFIHSGHFYSAPSSPLPLRGAPDYSTDTVSEFHAETHRQLQVKDLPKVPT